MTPAEKQQALKRFADDPDMWAHPTKFGLETHCNFFVQRGAQLWNCTELNAKTANEIVGWVKSHPNWAPTDEAGAQQAANEDKLVIAGCANPAGHGHVNIIIPGTMQESGKWGRKLPVCVNVGKDNFYGKHIGFAFVKTEPPSYWIWGGNS